MKLFRVALACLILLSPAFAAKNLYAGWPANFYNTGDFWNGQSIVVFVTGDAKLAPTLSQQSVTHVTLGIVAGTTLDVDSVALAVVAKGDNVIQSVTNYTYNGSSLPQSISISSLCSFTPSTTHPCLVTFDLLRSRVLQLSQQHCCRHISSQQSRRHHRCSSSRVADSV